MLFLNAESQVIHTDQKNILIRALTLRKHKGESSSKNAKIVTSGEGSRKRYFSIYYLWLKFLLHYPNYQSSAGLFLYKNLFSFSDLPF